MTDAEAPIDLDAPDGPSPVPRRHRQRWYWAGGVVLLVAAIAIAVAAIGPAHAPHRPPPGPPPPSTGPLGWIEALVDGPARGGLAGDKAFAQDLPARITELLQQTGSFPVDLYGIDRNWHPDQEVRLLFADDIGTQRVVLVALRLPMTQAPTQTPKGGFGAEDPNLPGNRTKVLWFVAPRGASVDAMLSYFTGQPDGGVFAGSMPATPFLLVNVSYINDFAKVKTIGLAPHGCSVSTASTNDLDAFVDEPTGSYIVRTEQTYRPEFWRVTCGGTVHEQRPAPVSFHVPSLAEIHAALDGAAGLSPADAQRIDVQDAVAQTLTEINSRGSELTGAARVVWAGTPQVDPDVIADPPIAVVTAAPAVPSGWFVAMWFGSLLGGYAGQLGSALIHTDSDPAAGVASSLQFSDDSVVLVLAPPSARGVRLQTPTGGVVRDAVLTTRAAVLAAPADPNAQFVQAYDGTGTSLNAPAPVLSSAPDADQLSDWSGTPVIPG